jgi:anti-sigma B factor antagonist
MTITKRVVGDVTILVMGGRLVLYEGETALRDAIDELIQDGRLQIILDLKDVTYIDSAGVGQIIAKYLSVRRKGGDVKLLHLSQRSLHVMTITRLLGVFETFGSEEEAVASFSVRSDRPAAV